MTRRRRVEAMRSHDVRWCPPWCAQPDDEAGEHVSEWVEIESTVGDGGVRVRASLGWFTWCDTSPSVEIEVSGDVTSGLLSIGTDLELFRAALTAAEELAADEDDPEVDNWIPAYPGAELEGAATT